jgi:tetratricopeptide (TPR) repeat protein
MDWSDRYLAWKEQGGHAKLTGTALGAFAVAAGAGFVWHVPAWQAPLYFVGGGLAGYWVSRGVVLLSLDLPARAAQAVYMPARTGAYASEHSEIDAREARGDYAGAAAAWDEVAAAEPANPWALVRAGELYGRKLSDPARAIDRFRRARDLPVLGPELDRYVRQKIVDLLLGPLKETGRAMVELRMLIDRYPDSREAEGAREALRRIKSETLSEP